MSENSRLSRDCQALFSLRQRGLFALALLLGVTFIGFLLMVYFGPEQTYSLLGKNPSKGDIDNVRHALGYDRPLAERYLRYLSEIFTFDFGASTSTQEKVSELLARTVPVSLAIALPGFFLGNALALVLALWAVSHRGAWQDRLIMFGSVTGMSISLLIVIIGLQILLCTSDGLDVFPVQGWDVHSLGAYLHYATVPVLATVFVALGYNTRFFRAVLVEELGRDHVRTARAFGCRPVQLLVKHVLRNSLVPISTRILASVPYVVIGGSLLIESFFNIPGIGSATHDAVMSGDLPVVKAVVSLTAVLYTLILNVLK